MAMRVQSPYDKLIMNVICSYTFFIVLALDSYGIWTQADRLDIEGQLRRRGVVLDGADITTLTQSYDIIITSINTWI